MASTPGHSSRKRFRTSMRVQTRGKAQSRIQESREYYHAIFEAGPFPKVLYDPATFAILAVNDAAVELYGYRRDEFLAITLKDLRPPEEAPKLVAAFAQPLPDRYHAGIWTHRKKDGALIEVDVYTHAMLLNGRTVHLAELYDVTERRRTEAALVKRTQQLEAVRAIAAEIAQELDITNVLRLVARRACELTGATAADIDLWDPERRLLVLEASYGHAVPYPGTTRRLGEGAMGTVAQTLQGLILNDYRSSPVAHPDTLAHTTITASIVEPLIYRDTLLGVIGVDHETPGRIFTTQDRDLLRLFAAQAAIAIENARLFAELNESYAQLQQAQAELVRSEKLRGLGQMAAGIAHDLNNRLAAILAQVELLKLRGAPPEVREGLDILETAATDGARVVRRLQDFARQRTASPLAPMDLGQAVQETLEITRPRWQDEVQQRGKTIAVQVALGDLPPILGHAPEVREALTNLIFNAVEAMPDGGTLTFAGAAAPDWITLHMTDTGIGMPEAVRQKVFEPFFTTKGVKGTGLGLSVVYGIMERHGGRVDATSVPGQGTTFTLRFQQAPAGPSGRAPARQSVARASRCILVIDDEAVVRRTMTELLQAAGHIVLAAESGPAGLAQLEHTLPDLVLTDLGMPEMSGAEVARRVKAAHPRLPVILLTGWGDTTTLPKADRQSVDRVLGKPVRLADLLQVVAELTESGHSEERVAPA